MHGVFFVDPENEKALALPTFRDWYRRRHRIRSGAQTAPFMLFLGIPGFPAIVMALGFLVDPVGFFRGHLVAGIIFAIAVPLILIGLLVVAIRGVRLAQRHYRLVLEGTVVTGEVVTCTASEFLEVPKLNPLKCRPWVRLDLVYSVWAPSGKQVRKMVRITRNDLLLEQAPTPGTPVYVLLLDESMYSVL